MSLAQEITNLYLYGQSTTPSDLSDERSIGQSSISSNPVIDIDVQDYMQNVLLRFAIGSQFNIVGTNEKCFYVRFVNSKRAYFLASFSRSFRTKLILTGYNVCYRYESNLSNIQCR